MTLRAVEDADWRGILRVERARYGAHGYDVTFVRMIPVVFARSCWVACEGDGGIVGYALGARDEREPGVGWVLSVAVDVDVDGRGIGTRLTEACVAGLVASGMRCVRLTVAPDNERARRLYARLGFVEVGLERDYFGPGEDRLVMERATP